MKKLFFLFCFTFFSELAQSQYTLTANDVTFSDGVITGYINKTEKDIIIPDNFDGVAVTAIGEDAFSAESFTGRNNPLASVIIPNSVKTIGRGAFYHNDLASVVIPNSVKTIEQDAFYWNKLSSVSIPNSVISIGYRAFYRNNLTSVSIPNSVISIFDLAFYDNNLTSVSIPNSVKTIGEYAFDSNDLTSFTLPSPTISGNWNSGSAGEVVSDLTISYNYLAKNYVATASDFLFENGVIQDYYGPGGVVTIPASIDGESVTSIGSYAFSRNNLIFVSIPNSVNYIGDRAFYSNDLASFHLPVHYQGYSYSWNDDENSSYNSGDQVTDLTKEFSIGTKGDAVQFSIDYKLDGGVSTNPVTYTVEDATISLSDASKEDFTFNGWFTDTAFTEPITEIPSGSTGDIEVFAKFESISGMLDFNNKRFQFYPNPSFNFIETDLDIAKLTIYNSQGTIILQFTKTTNTYDVSQLEPGTYLIKASSTEGTVYTSKIVKE